MAANFALSMALGCSFPNPEVETTIGNFRLYDYQHNSWLIFFSHPADYTPVCTTELARAAALAPEFAKRNVKMIALSCDTIDDHNKWSEDVLCFANLPGKRLPFPVIADSARELAVRFGMLDSYEKDKQGLPLTCRAVFIVDPEKILRLQILYPKSVGRNFDEILRVIDALQLNDAQKVVTPADWKKGERVLIPPTAAAENYPNPVEIAHLPSSRTYLRFTTVSDGSTYP